MADSQGLVTLVVSVYNIETLLPACLASISDQTYRNLEILLIDDGSTDGSGRLCDEYAAADSRARVIHQENRGLWAVRNRGLEEARGEYVAFPDGDDRLHRDYVRLLYEAIHYGGKEYPLALCDYRRVRHDEELVESDTEPSFEVMEQTALLDGIIGFPSCKDAFWGANWNKLYRKSSLSRPFQKEYRRCQDFDSNLRVYYSVEQAVHVRKVLYDWVQWTGQSIRSSDYLQLRMNCRSRIYLDHFRTIPSRFSAWRPCLAANLSRVLIVMRDDAQGKEEYQAVRKMIRGYEEEISSSLLHCKQEAVVRRMRLFLSLRAPFLLRLLGKEITHEDA